MSHLNSSSLIAAFDVETLVWLRAVEDRLITPDFFCHMIQCLYDMKTKVFPLLVFCNGDIFNVTDETKIMDAIHI